MSVHTKIRQIGNSDGLTLQAEQLRVAGIARGEEVVVDAEPGRIVITKAESAHTQTMEALNVCMARYDATLRRLAK